MRHGFRRTPQGIAAVFDVVQAGVLRRLDNSVYDCAATDV